MDFYNPDTCLMTMEQYEKAKCRLLIVFPTPHENKTVSSTAAALNDYVIEHCPDTFIDFAYMPEGSDVSLYDEYNMPYAIGNITHLDPSHFDIVGFSISVLSDIISAPVQLKSFERCDKPIPLFWSDRKDLPLGQHPIIMAGGITLAVGDVLYGKVGDKESFIDFAYLGECAKMNLLTNRYIEAIEKGYCTRHQEDHDVNGVPHQDIENFQEVCTVKTVQDYIDAQFDCRWIYQPQAYEVRYNKSNQIISNKKINHLAQDWVRPYYAHVLHEDLGIGRTIINANGDMAGTAQTQISEGAMLKGTLIRTNKGFKRVEELCQAAKGNSPLYGDIIVDTSKGAHSLYHQFNQGIKPVKVIKLKSGRTISLTPEHPIEQWTVGDKETHFVNAGDLQLGDYVITGSSQVWADCSFTIDEAEFLGRMLGDGSYNYYSDPRSTHPNPYHRMYLCCSWAEVEYCEDLLKRAGIAYTKDTKQGRHCRFWILSTDLKGRRMDEYWGFNQFYRELPNGQHGKYIPTPVYSFGREQMCAFLKGFHDADGCSSTKLGLSKITFDCSLEYIIDDIQQFLFAVGIPSVKHFYKHTRCADETLGFKDTISNHWSLVISTEYADVFNSLGVNKRASRKSTKTKEKLPIDGLSEFISKRSGNRGRLLRSLSEHSFTKYRATLENIEFPDYFFDEVVSISDSVGEVYDLSVVDVERLYANGVSIHNCSASGSCSFCSEGTYCSGWVEKTQERVLWESRECKKYSAGYKYKPYSFNSNYYTDYKGMLKKWIQIYPKVSFINMRMEELGRDVDAIRMMRLIGSNRIASPLEGLSPRIQNNLLNKCLSTESLTNFMEEMVHSKLTDIKVGAIYTGMEEDEDFQWMYDFIKRLKQKANDEGGRFPIRINMTPLVHYPLTPLEYVERKTAYRSYKEQRWFTDEWYEKYREVNMRVKVHGFRFSTFVEQSIVDLGRALTPLIYKHFVSTITPIYTLRSVVTKEFVEDLKNFIDPETHFADRDPEHYISPCHRIHIELMGSYIPRARRLLQFKRAGRIFDNPPDERCLKTYDGAHTTCQKKCIFKQPLIIYNDVTMDENGNLHGDGRPLEGCERCISNEERKNRLARPIFSTANIDDIIATPRIPQVQKIRFLLYRKPEYDLYSANATSHTFITKFLQKSDTLLDSYHSVITHNMFWQSEPVYKSFISGFQIVDTMWSKNVIKEVKELISEVNDSLVATKVISAEEVLRDEKLDVQDYNIYYFESSLPKEYFDSAKISYSGEIKVDVGTSAAIVLETHKDPALKNTPLFFASKGKVCGAFALPLKFSPTNFLSSYLSTVKRVGIDTLVETTTISCELTVRENLNACKNCGKEHAVISLSTGKPMAFGVSCLCKALLTQKLKNV